MDSPEERFKSAVSLLGESWLENHLDSESKNDSGSKTSYQVPQSHDQPPPVVKSYRMAREDLYDEQTTFIDLPDWRNEALEFLRLGYVFEITENAPIVDPNGSLLNGVSVKQLYQDRLRSQDEYESSRYELEVAAAYKELGHEPAFIKEDLSPEQTPDIVLRDLSPTVQIECKHCRKQSDEEKKQSKRANILFENIRSALPGGSYIVILDLDRTPTKSEVERVSDYLPSSNEIGSSRKTELTIPFAELSIIEFPFEAPFPHSVYDMEGFEIMNSFHDDFIRPVLSRDLNIDKKFRDFGNSVLLFEAKRNKTTLLIRRVTFIAIKESTWGSDVYKRFRNQFKKVSGKFDGTPAVLHIDFPNLEEGDSLQELELRKHAGGELKMRPALSGVVVSGLIQYPVFSDDLITRRRIHIPNYNPKYELPDQYKPLEGVSDRGISIDQLMKSSVQEELLRDPKGGKKALNQEEGTLSFRFKPDEPRPQEESKFIIDGISEDENTRLALSITPDERIELQWFDVKTGHWTCSIDVSEVPEYEPLRIFITWSPDEIGLSVGHQSFDKLKHASSTEADGEVASIDGVPQVVKSD